MSPDHPLRPHTTTSFIIMTRPHLPRLPLRQVMYIDIIWSINYYANTVFIDET